MPSFIQEQALKKTTEFCRINDKAAENHLTAESRPPKKAKIQSTWHGETTYPESMTLQQKAANEIQKNPTQIKLLGFEYDNTLTYGRRVHESQIPPKLFSKFKVYPTDRGGLMTLHHKGQLVIYPVMNLQQHKLSVRSYIELLHKVTAEFLDEFGIVASWNQQNPQGLFTENGKIAFCGIRVHQGIATHGMSINVANALEEFACFNPCGLEGPRLDSLSANGISISLESAFLAWAKVLGVL